MSSTTVDVANIDGVDVADYDVYLTNLPNLWSAPPASYQSLAIPDSAGVQITNGLAQHPPRVIMLNARFQETSSANAETKKQAFIDAISGRLCRVSFDHASGRSYYGVYQGLEADPFAPLALQGGWLNLAVPFLCPDPFAIDDDLTVVSGDSRAAIDRVEIPVGTGPVYPLVTITGPVTAPAIVFRDHTGAQRASVALATTVAAGDWWQFDALHWLSRKSVSGVVSSNMSAVSYSGFPVVQERYGVRALSKWPTISTTGGVMVVEYFRRWR